MLALERCRFGSRIEAVDVIRGGVSQVETWEYKVHLISLEANPTTPPSNHGWSDGGTLAKDPAALLNMWGQAGWELVNACLDTNGSKPSIVCFFKRRRS